MSKPTPWRRIFHNALAKKGMSEDAGAKVIGCSQPCLNRWINGFTTPGVRHLRGISRLTGMSIDELVGVHEKEAEK